MKLKAENVNEAKSIRRKKTKLQLKAENGKMHSREQ